MCILGLGSRNAWIDAETGYVLYTTSYYVYLHVMWLGDDVNNNNWERNLRIFVDNKNHLFGQCKNDMNFFTIENHCAITMIIHVLHQLGMCVWIDKYNGKSIV